MAEFHNITAGVPEGLPAAAELPGEACELPREVQGVLSYTRDYAPESAV